MYNKDLEQTLVLIKPDAMKNSLAGYIFSQLSEFHTGLIFAAAKVVHVTSMLAEEHYAEHRGKVFYPQLIEYLTGQLHYPDEPQKRRVAAIIYQGPGAIEKIRELAGPTNPHLAREERPGCIRSLGTIVPISDAMDEAIGERMDNLIHGSAVREDAEREIKLWFKPSDIPPFMRAFPVTHSEDHFYFKEDRLFKSYEPGSVCLLAPGDVAWESDLQSLQRIYQGLPARCSLRSIVAKHLVNRKISVQWQ